MYYAETRQARHLVGGGCKQRQAKLAHIEKISKTMPAQAPVKHVPQPPRIIAMLPNSYPSQLRAALIKQGLLKTTEETK